jgi:hypothetical protein
MNNNDNLPTAFEIARACATNGGATINPRNQRNVTNGYAVGLGGADSLPQWHADRITDAFVGAVDAATATAQKMDGGALGAWIHRGRVYVEPVEVLQDRDRAMNVARMRGEIAIFDLNTGTEIEVK